MVNGDLPDGWTMVTVGEISESINPGFPSGQHNQEKVGVPHIRPMNISRNGDIELSVVKYVEPKEYSPLMQHDVLFNNTNSPELVGKTTCIHKNTDWAFSNHMTRIRLRKDIAFSGWVAKVLHYLFLDGYFKLNCRHHVNQASVSSGFLSDKVSIPLPPLPEQQRIVARIEELFTQLDAGVAGLRRVQAGLKRYKASVLKAAVEGRLVGHGGAVPVPGELPEGWRWVTLEKLSENIVDCLHSTPNFVREGRYCIDTTCIEPGKILFSKARLVSEETYQDRIRRLKPNAGDILFSREGTIGTTVIVPDKVNLCLGQRMMMFRPATNIMSSYLMWAMLSDTFERQWKPKIIGTTSPHINIRDIRQMVLPLPPLSEQRRIVAEVERRLSVAQQVEAGVQAQLARAARLRQAVLKAAFEGRLV